MQGEGTLAVVAPDGWLVVLNIESPAQESADSRTDAALRIS
jgi:sarcosine oxidase gamma subunit